MIGNTLLLGKYQIEETIYQSKQSEVYKALDIHRGVHVAIKLLPVHEMTDETALERIRREAKVLEQLDHPNIVRIYEFFPVGNQIGIVMEYVEGQNLRRLLIEKKNLTLSKALNITKDIGTALKYAHEKGIFHRDIKPENILIGQDGEARLADFGIARFREATSLGNSGSIVGTPGYLAPEQYRGQEGDTHSDLFCLGLILYEMLAGQSPFDVDPALDIDQRLNVLAYQAQKKIMVSRDLGEAAPAGVKMVIQKALEIKRRKRHKSVEQFLVELEREARPYLSEIKNTTERINLIFREVKARSEPIDALLEALVVGTLTAIISNLITYSSIALVLALLGGTLALALNLILKAQGYARISAWATGTAIMLIGVSISLFVPTDFQVSVISKSTPTLNVLETGTIQPPNEEVSTSTPTITTAPTSTSIPTLIPTSTPMSEPSSGRTEIAPAPPPAEKFVTQIDAIENDGCTSCGVRFELNVITNTLRPLPGAVVYIKQKSNVTMPNSTRSGSDGSIATISFSDEYSLTLLKKLNKEQD